MKLAPSLLTNLEGDQPDHPDLVHFFFLSLTSQDEYIEFSSLSYPFS